MRHHAASTGDASFANRATGSATGVLALAALPVALFGLAAAPGLTAGAALGTLAGTAVHARVDAGRSDPRPEPGVEADPETPPATVGAAD